MNPFRRPLSFLRSALLSPALLLACSGIAKSAGFTNNMDATLVIGQLNFTNQDTVASQTVTPSPFSCAVSATGKLVVSDISNGVLLWNSIPAVNGTPANVVIGRGLTPANRNLENAHGLAFSPNGQKLIVADSSPNRVFIWNSIPATSGVPADVVLGQPDFSTASYATTATGLGNPTGIVVTPGGKLLVSEMINNRILIWNSIPTTSGAAADVVIGQPNKTSSASGSGLNQFNLPTGLAITNDGRLLVCDANNNRVLIYSSIPTTDGASANIVIGQTGPGLSTSATTQTGMNFPRGVSVSSSGQVAVADQLNNRVLIYNTLPVASGAAADAVLGQPDFTSNTSYNGGISAHSMNWPTGACFLPDGRLAVTGFHMHRVMVFTPELPPEMSVEGNGTVIADGDTTPVLADHTDFGSTATINSSTARTFTIKSTGGPLNLTGTTRVSVSGANAADFYINAQPAASVAGGGSTTFQVTFAPLGTGTRTAVISIANDDADENPYDFVIQGTGTTATPSCQEIKYVFFGEGTGTFNGVPFNNQPFKIVAYGDQGGVFFPGGTFPRYANPIGRCEFGFGPGPLFGVVTQIPGPLWVVSEMFLSTQNRIKLADTTNQGDAGLIRAQVAAGTPYNLATQFSQINFSLSHSTAEWSPRQTTSGPLFFSALSSFTATSFKAEVCGAAQDYPIMPNGPVLSSGNPPGPTDPPVGIVWPFWNVSTDWWFDPPMAAGYEFKMLGGALFDEIVSLPVGVDGDNAMFVKVGSATYGPFQGGQRVNFVTLHGSAVSSFRILGIDPGLNPNDSAAFPVQLSFNTSLASFTMQPILNPQLSLTLQSGGTTGLACIPENTPAGSVVGTFSATHADPAQAPFTYALVGSGNDNASFSLSGNALTLLPSPDFETKSSYTIGVRVTSSGGLTQDETLTVPICNVNEVPSFTKGANQSHPAMTGPISLPGWATGMNDGDSTVVQSLSFTASIPASVLFSVPPAINAAGDLTYTLSGAAGSAVVSVTLTDDASIPGSVPRTTPAQTFTIAVAPGTFKYFVGDTDTTVGPNDAVNQSTRIAAAYPGAVFKGLDDTTVNRWVGHVFENLPPGIVQAQLNIRMAPGNGGESNDSMGLGINPTAPAWAWTRNMFSFSAGGGWVFGTNPAQTFNFDLSNLPGAVNILPKLNADRYLDLFVQDDTTVDWFELCVTTGIRPPTISVNGGSITAPEGSTAVQTGVFSDPDGTSTVTLTASAGILTQNTAAGTWSWTFNTSGVDGPTGGPITITATDSTGSVVSTVFQASLTNLAPTVTISAPSTGMPGIPVNFTITATDPSTADQTAGFTWSRNFGDGSGPVIYASGTASPLAVTRTYYANGIYTVTVTATDKDGGISAVATKVICITPNGAPPIEGWRSTHFGSTANTGNGANTADPDNDGIANLFEFAFGLTPTSGGSLQLPTAVLAGGNLVSTFTQPPGVACITYGAQWSTDLVSWTPIPDTGSGTTHTFSVPAGSQRKFIRYVVTEP